MSFSRRASILGKSQTLMGDKDNPIIIDNTKEDQSLSGFKVYGMCNQFVDEGINLIPFNKLINRGNYNGVIATNRGDGTYLCQGTCERNSSANIWFAGNYMVYPTEETTLFVLNGGQNYYVKDCVLCGYYEDMTFKVFEPSWQNKNFNFIYWIDKDIKITGIRYFGKYYGTNGWNFYPSGKQVYEICCPMVAKSNKPLPWSPPTRGILTPSPSNPSPITFAGSNSKQKFNYQTASQDQLYGTNGQLQASSGMTSSALISVSSNSPYTISYQGEDEKITSLIICEFNTNQTMTSRLTGSLPYTITTALDTVNIGLTFYNSQTNEAVTVEDTKYIMVNSGESSVDLEDYDENGLKIKINISNEDESQSSELVIPLSENLYGVPYNPEKTWIIPTTQDGMFIINGIRYYCNYRDYDKGMDINCVKKIYINGQSQSGEFDLKYYKDNNSELFIISITNEDFMTIIPNDHMSAYLLCDRFCVVSQTRTSSNKYFEGMSMWENFLQFYQPDLFNGFSDEEFKQWFVDNPTTVYMVCKSQETPIPQEELTAFQNLHLYNGKTKITTEDNNAMLSIDAGD